MKHFNVSKFNRADSVYLEDWTSIWEALDERCNDAVKWSEYLAVEKRYLEYIVSFLLNNNINQFSLHDIEINLDNDTKEEFSKLRYGLLDPEWSTISKVKCKTNLSLLDLISLFQLALRGIIWFKLIDKKSGSYLSFGDDYYILLGVTEFQNVPATEDYGLYINETRDPWE